MKIYLLTHAREVHKKTNTGQLALSICPDLCERIIWDRVNPDPRLLSLPENSALLYPKAEVINDDSAWLASVEALDVFVVLDATWQEARKMYNRSPYLHPLQKFSLPDGLESEFQLRRNQKAGGLCTAETVAYLLKEKDFLDASKNLQQAFNEFNSAC